MYTVPPRAALYTPEYALLHKACVSFTYSNKMKQFWNYWYPVLKRRSADADKPARRV